MTKTQQAKNLLDSGDLKGALRIAKSFKLGLSPEQCKAIGLGYEALVHPGFYTQLGKDPAQLIAQGVAALNSAL